MPVCLIALGSNVNASKDLFENALHELSRSGIATLALSRIVTTRPVGSEAGLPFLNAAATVECHMSPMQLLRSLHDVESAFGRTRTMHWGPRTLDLDLLLYGDEVIDQHDLVVPHPSMWYRRFVLDPANDVAPNMKHPILLSTVGDLHRALQARPLHIRLEFRTEDFESPPDLVNVIEQLRAAVPGLIWHQTHDAGNDPAVYFARVILQRRPSEPTLRTQPRNPDDRSIIVDSQTEQQTCFQLTQLAAAMLG